MAPTDSITARRAMVLLSRGFVGSASAYLLQNGPDTSQSRDSALVCTSSRGRLLLWPFLLFLPPPSLPSFSPPPPPSLLSLSPDLSIASSATLTFWTATPKTEGTPSAHVASQLIQHRCNVNMLGTCHMQHQVCCAIAAQVFSFSIVS